MGHGRIYNVVVSQVAVSAAQDLFEVVAPATDVVIIRSLEIAQSSDAGDTEDEMIAVSIISGNTTSGSGGTSPTAVPLRLGDSAFGGTVEINNTTVATAGTAVTHRASAFNVRAGYVWMPDPDAMIILPPSARIVVRLTAPADALTVSATLTFEEIG